MSYDLQGTVISGTPTTAGKSSPYNPLDLFCLLFQSPTSAIWISSHSQKMRRKNDLMVGIQLAGRRRKGGKGDGHQSSEYIYVRFPAPVVVSFHAFYSARSPLNSPITIICPAPDFGPALSISARIVESLGRLEK